MDGVYEVVVVGVLTAGEECVTTQSSICHYEPTAWQSIPQYIIVIKIDLNPFALSLSKGMFMVRHAHHEQACLSVVVKTLFSSSVMPVSTDMVDYKRSQCRARQSSPQHVIVSKARQS